MVQRGSRFRVLALAGVLAVLIASTACSGNSRKVKLVPQPSLGNGIYRLQGIDKGAELIWSPDGKYLARLDRQMPVPDCFTCGKSYSEIFLVNTETWEKQTVLRTEFHVKDVMAITWFPDSQQIAYVPSAQHAGDPTSVWSIDIDGKNDHEYLQQEGMPIWSPDGTKIAFLDLDGRIPVLYVFDPSSGEKTLGYKSEEAGYAIRYVTWVPGSQAIAFSYGEKPDVFVVNEDIYVLDLESGKVTQVTDDAFDYRAPEYSPGGNLLAVQRRDSRNQGKAYQETTIIKDLAQDCEMELPIPDTYSVSWAPNGQKLVVTAAGGDYIVDLTELSGEGFRETGSICR